MVSSATRTSCRMPFAAGIAMTRGCTCRSAQRQWVDGRCERCGHDVAEVQIQDAIRLAFGSDPRVVLWRNNCGVARTASGGAVTYGVANPGGADLIGIFEGRFLAIEVKSRTGRSSPEQVVFGELVKRKGGIYILARSVEDVRRGLG